jgi:hypothetical protein
VKIEKGIRRQLKPERGNHFHSLRISLEQEFEPVMLHRPIILNQLSSKL